MSPRTITIVVLALVFSGSAAIGVNQLLSRTGEAKEDGVPVVVAMLDVPRGTMLSSDMVRVVQRPKSSVLIGTIDKPENAVDRAVFAPLIKDEPILEGKLAPKGAGVGMSPLIPKGMRAITIRTPSVDTAVAGFILPGNRVDVLLTMTSPMTTEDDPTEGASTTTLLNNVEILAVDQLIDSPAANKVDQNQLRSVTLLVKPSQARMLELGQNKGVLHLVLRNLEDDADTDVGDAATLRDIRFRSDEPNKKTPELLTAPEPAKEIPAEKDEPVAEPAPVVASAPAPPAGPRKVEIPIRSVRGNDQHNIPVQIMAPARSPR
jgi:pilus assembly protein CpaB